MSPPEFQRWIASRGLFSRAQDRFKAARLRGERGFGRQPLHAARAVKAVTISALRQHKTCVSRLRDRPAVTKDEDVVAHAKRSSRDRVDARRTVRRATARSRLRSPRRPSGPYVRQECRRRPPPLQPPPLR